MKVRCMDNNYGKLPLTINKIYSVESCIKSYYYIKNDEGNARNYSKERFEIIEEKESDNMEKYKIYEVLQMIEENKELKFTDDIYDVFYDKDFNVVRILNKTNCKVNIKGLGLGRIFYLIKQSVAFKEVLNSDKMCRVEHELIKKRFDTDVAMDFEKFDDLIFFLSNNLNEQELKEIMKNGKWYLED